MATHEMTLELNKEGYSVPNVITVRVGDGAEVIKATLTRDGAAASLTGCKAHYMAAKPDRSYVQQSMSISGSVATVTVDPTAFGCVGLMKVSYIRVTNSSGKYESTGDILVNVLPDAENASEGLSGPYVSEVDAVLAERMAALQEIADLDEAIRASEAARASAEKTRAANETARKSNETARQSAETSRAAAESARATAEKSRAAAESAREAAEDAREDAEGDREDAEAARAKAETARQSAETSRVAAETARAKESATLKTDSEKATAAANGAASSANAAANTCLEIANSVAQGSAGDSDIAELRSQVDALGSMVADLKGEFYYLDGTIYAPSSKASISGTTVTLAGTCSASGTTITLA